MKTEFNIKVRTKATAGGREITNSKEFTAWISEYATSSAWILKDLSVKLKQRLSEMRFDCRLISGEGLKSEIKLPSNISVWRTEVRAPLLTNTVKLRQEAGANAPRLLSSVAGENSIRLIATLLLVRAFMRLGGAFTSGVKGVQSAVISIAKFRKLKDFDYINPAGDKESAANRWLLSDLDGGTLAQMDSLTL